MGFWEQHFYLAGLIDRRVAESGAAGGGSSDPHTIADMKALPTISPEDMMTMAKRIRR